MSIGKRLEEERKSKGYKSQNALADALGISYPTISRWENDTTTIPSDKCALMSELGLDILYILTGKSVTLPASADIKENKNNGLSDYSAKKPVIVTVFDPNNEIDDSKTTDGLSLAEGMSVYSVREDELAPLGVSKPPELEGYVFIPVLDIEASSGDGRLALSENVTEYVPFSIIELRKNNLNPKYLVGAHNKGDSMAPTLPERGLFVYDESKTRVDGGIFFFLYHDEFYIKRLTREGDNLRVISDNPAYPAWVIEDVENCHVIGKKVWHERWGG